MATFVISGKQIRLPATQIQELAHTRDRSAWMGGCYITVRLLTSISTLRVHTNGRSFRERPASGESGAWLLIGDVIKTSTDLASSRSLPVQKPDSMTAFTHTSAALIAAGTALNIGIASAKFGGLGGGFQAEFVSGPPIQFTPLAGKHWHGTSGHT